MATAEHQGREGPPLTGAAKAVERVDQVVHQFSLYLRLRQLRKDPEMNRRLDEMARDLEEWHEGVAWTDEGSERAESSE